MAKTPQDKMAIESPSETPTETTAVPADGKSLPIVEAFCTLQGEGFHTGKAAYFIRTAGCDVGCFWCDVKESWDREKHPVLGIEEIIGQALEHEAKIAVITGGEPLMHPLAPLTSLLHKNGFQTHIETSGAHPLSGNWDWICLSPKKFKAPLEGVASKAHELKVVVYNKDDFKWAAKYASMVGPDCKLFLQPEWSRSAEVLPLIVDYVKQHPEWTVSLQTHKFMQIP